MQLTCVRHDLYFIHTFTNMNIREIIGALEHCAPLSLQDGYDNAGRQIGLTEDAEASGALLCLDVNEEVVEEAHRLGCNLIVSHHPLLFHGVKQLTGADYVQRCIIKAIQYGISIYAAHTNLDNAVGGVSWEMASYLGLTSVETLQPKPEAEDGAGAGIIGILPEPMERDVFIQHVKQTFRVPCVRCNAWTGQTVRRVALCGGAGAFLIPAAVAAEADVFLTGEIGYHRFFGLERDIQLLEIGHFESEQYTIGLLERLLHETDPSLRVVRTAVTTNPIRYVV